LINPFNDDINAFIIFAALRKAVEKFINFCMLTIEAQSIEINFIVIFKQFYAYCPIHL